MIIKHYEDYLLIDVICFWYYSDNFLKNSVNK